MKLSAILFWRPIALGFNPEEAKQMKYGEKKERPIYGEATLDQTKELAEEEIDVVPLPWSIDKKTN